MGASWFLSLTVFSKGVLVSLGFCNKYHKLHDLEHQNLLSRSFEVRSLKSKCWQCHAPSNGIRKGLFQAYP